MRTRQQHEYAYNGLTTAEFGERTGQSAAQVLDLIDSGWFDWDTEDGKPACLDIAGVNARQPTFRIHPAAVERFYKERRAGRRKYPPRRKKEDATA
jgi:hypothetical protein